MASISSLFGYILNFIYELVQNYGIAIIIFSVLLKLILLAIKIKNTTRIRTTTISNAIFIYLLISFFTLYPPNNAIIKKNYSKK